MSRSFPHQTAFTLARIPGCNCSKCLPNTSQTYSVFLTPSSLVIKGAYACRAPARRYPPWVSLPADAADTTNLEPSSAGRAKMISKSLKIALNAPVSSPARPVLQKQGSRELTMIGYGLPPDSLPVPGSTRLAILMTTYKSKSLERLYLSNKPISKWSLRLQQHLLILIHHIDMGFIAVPVEDVLTMSIGVFRCIIKGGT